MATGTGGIVAAAAATTTTTTTTATTPTRFRSHLVEYENELLAGLGQHRRLHRLCAAAQRIPCVQHLENNVSGLHYLKRGKKKQQKKRRTYKVEHATESVGCDASLRYNHAEPTTPAATRATATTNRGGGVSFHEASYHMARVPYDTASYEVSGKKHSRHWCTPS